MAFHIITNSLLLSLPLSACFYKFHFFFFFLSVWRPIHSLRCLRNRNRNRLSGPELREQLFKAKSLTEMASSTPPSEEPQEQQVKECVHKTKLIQFLGRTTPVVLQNDNGPCPLLAICKFLFFSLFLAPLGFLSFLVLFFCRETGARRLGFVLFRFWEFGQFCDSQGEWLW